MKLLIVLFIGVFWVSFIR